MIPDIEERFSSKLKKASRYAKRFALGLPLAAALALMPADSESQELPPLRATHISAHGQDTTQYDEIGERHFTLEMHDAFDIDPDHVQYGPDGKRERSIDYLVRRIESSGGDRTAGEWIMEGEGKNNTCIDSRGNLVDVQKLVRYVDNPIVPENLGLDPGDYMVIVTLEPGNSCSFSDHEIMYLTVTDHEDREVVSERQNVVNEMNITNIYIDGETEKEFIFVPALEKGQDEGWEQSALMVGGVLSGSSGFMEHLCDDGCEELVTYEGRGAGLHGRLFYRNEDVEVFGDGRVVWNDLAQDPCNCVVRIDGENTAYMLRGNAMYALAGPAGVGASADHSRFLSDDIDSLDGVVRSESSVKGELGAVLRDFSFAVGAGPYSLDFNPPGDEDEVSYDGMIAEARARAYLLQDEVFSVDADASLGRIWGDEGSGARGRVSVLVSGTFGDDVRLGPYLGVMGSARNIEDVDSVIHEINEKDAGIVAGLRIEGF